MQESELYVKNYCKDGWSGTFGVDVKHQVGKTYTDLALFCLVRREANNKTVRVMVVSKFRAIAFLLFVTFIYAIGLAL